MRRLLPDDERFPTGLHHVTPAPAALYVDGTIVPGDALAVAIVGARRATPYGLEVARRLAADLAARGVTIVSGLARGIDAAAHRGALAAGGRTLAVLGSGLDVVYPPEHRDLAREVAAAGAVLTEHAPGTPPFPQHFPMRNRLIAGLALGVVVVEAAERSGALSTAAWAADLGRDVMAVPGRVTSPASRGTHRLIRDGAALVEDWRDVAAQLPEPLRAHVLAAAPVGDGGTGGLAAAGDGASAAALLATLGDEPVDLDHAIDRSGLPSGRVLALMLELELAGRVRPLGGQRYVRVS